MKAIYKGDLYQVTGDTGDMVQLVRVADLGADPYRLTVDYGDPDLLIDPTDAEVAEVAEDRDEN
jgi:hypothetical protein